MTRAKNRDVRDAKHGPRVPGRPEDPDTHRLRRSKRLLRNDMLPEGAAMVTQEGDETKDSETEATFKRVAEDREREEPGS